MDLKTLTEINGVAGHEQAIRRALGDVPFVLEADIGHVKPCFTLINGALGHITVENGRAKLEMELK